MQTSLHAVLGGPHVGKMMDQNVRHRAYRFPSPLLGAVLGVARTGRRHSLRHCLRVTPGSDAWGCRRFRFGSQLLSSGSFEKKKISTRRGRSQLGLRSHLGADGVVHHLHEVEGDFRSGF